MEADGVVEVHERAGVVIFLEIREAPLRVIVRNCIIIRQTPLTGWHSGVWAGPEFDGLTALRKRAIVFLLEVVDDAAVIKCIGIFLINPDGLTIVCERE